MALTVIVITTLMIQVMVLIARSVSPPLSSSYAAASDACVGVLFLPGFQGDFLPARWGFPEFRVLIQIPHGRPLIARTLT